jgi:type III secretion protein J
MAKKIFLLFFLSFLCVGCQKRASVVSNIDEKQANEIVVYLASKGIKSQKVLQPSAAIGRATAKDLYNIQVDASKQLEAMAILNRVGLPRRMGTTLLDLFSDTGLMTSDKQETIRYNSGIERDLENMIRQIDGVIDAVVKLSIPQQSAIATPDEQQAKPTAAVYVKHEGIVDEPNSHLITKIKRLVSSSIPELSFDSVTVVSDRSRFTDVLLPQQRDMLYSGQPEMITLWSVTMDKNSVSTFRSLFFLFSLIIIVFALIIGFLVWKLYPFLTRGGLKTLLSIKPIEIPKESGQTENE